jgi:hypothetical protein
MGNVQISLAANPHSLCKTQVPCFRMKRIKHLKLHISACLLLRVVRNDRRKGQYFGRWLWEYRDRAFECTNRKALWIVINTDKLLTGNFNLMFKRQTCYTEITFVTVHDRCSKFPRSTSVQSKVLCEDCMLFVWVDLHVSLCRQQHPKCERAIGQVFIFLL